jgi:hypothetical protein
VAALGSSASAQRFCPAPPRRISSSLGPAFFSAKFPRGSRFPGYGFREQVQL